MEILGKIVGSQKDYITGKRQVTFEIEDVDEDILESMHQDGVLTIDIKKKREKRSNNANALFHLIVSHIANCIGATNTEVKNRLIRDYGQYEYDKDGKIPTYLVKEEYVEEMLNRDDIHFKVEGREGDRVRLVAMRGSSTYDTKEFARLLDGAMSEARELGIRLDEV